MAKISSFVSKIFGKDAANIGQVGSAAAGTKVLTTSPTTIQALTAFTNGISDVTLSSKRIIPQEELMALHYLHSMASAYQQQEGIQEYNSGVTYFQKSIVKKAGTYELYGSLVDDNIGNALTDGTKWVLLQDLSSSGLTTSFLTSGYVIFPSGLIEQWGVVSNSSSNKVTVTFPIAFPNAIFGINNQCSQYLNSTTYGVAGYSDETLTNFNSFVHVNGDANAVGQLGYNTSFYKAIGH